MKIWLPYIRAGSGVDVYTKLLARGLIEAGHVAIPQELDHNYQYAPWFLRRLSAPAETEVVLTNSWSGYAFHRIGLPLIVVEHHCVFDPAYTPYRSIPQALFHEILVRPFEKRSFDAADAVVSVSTYTAQKVAEIFPGTKAQVIPNGIDTDFFCPREARIVPLPRRPFRLLFVGNLTARKGADLLPKIMTALGRDFELYYTTGLRTEDPFPGVANMQPMGRLSSEALREAFRDADALLFPTRLEGFGYAAAEAMACGTPVVTSNASALPEVIIDGETGLLCPPDDVQAFARAIRTLQENTSFRIGLGQAAQRRAKSQFSIRSMTERYITLFRALSSQGKANRD